MRRSPVIRMMCELTAAHLMTQGPNHSSERPVAALSLPVQRGTSPDIVVGSRASCDRDRGEVRIGSAALLLAKDGPGAASAALAPVLDGSAPVPRQSWLVHAFVLETIAGDVLGDPAAAELQVERALDIAQSDHLLFRFLIYPAPGLLARHVSRHPKQAALIAEVLALTPAQRSSEVARPPGVAEPPRLVDPLSQSEVRVLRYLPTSMSAGEIARGAVGVGEHGADAHASPVRQARRAQAHPGRRAGPRPRPAGTVPPRDLSILTRQATCPSSWSLRASSASRKAACEVMPSLGKAR
jgi:LuxR family transcriptional regulator, maltose regulon positive regulatory protein